MSNLTFKEYEDKAKETAIYPNFGSNIYYPALGLGGESGEVLENIKKMMRDDNGVLTLERKQKIKKELGDVLWYCALLAFESGLTLEEVAEANNSKLLKRLEENKIHGEGSDR